MEIHGRIPISASNAVTGVVIDATTILAQERGMNDDPPP